MEMTVQPSASAKAFRMALLPVTWEIFTASRRPNLAAPASKISLVKVAGPMLEEQTEMRAQLRAQRLLLTLLYTDRFRDDLPAFDRLMARLVQLTEEATETLPGGKCTSEAIAAKHRVQRLLSQFHNLVRSHAA